MQLLCPRHALHCLSQSNVTSIPFTLKHITSLNKSWLYSSLLLTSSSCCRVSRDDAGRFRQAARAKMDGKSCVLPWKTSCRPQSWLMAHPLMRTHSLGAMLRVICLFCRTVFGCCPRLGHHNNSGSESAELSLCSGPRKEEAPPPEGAAEYRWGKKKKKKNQVSTSSPNYYDQTQGRRIWMFKR